MLVQNTRSRAWRRYQTEVHMWRRLREDRAQHSSEAPPHYLETCPIEVSLFAADEPWGTPNTNNIGIYWANYKSTTGKFVCRCFYDLEAMSRFKEQPQCKTNTRFNQNRRMCGPTLQELKSIENEQFELKEFNNGRY